MTVRDKTKRVLWMAVGAAVLALSGCAETPPQRELPQAIRSTRIASRDGLRAALNVLEDVLVTTIRDAADRVEQEYADPRYKQLNVHLNTRLIQAVRTLMDNRDPLVCLIENWELCARLSYYFAQGDGAALYGPAAAQMMAAAQRNEAEAERVAAAYLPEATYEEAHKLVHNFAKTHPIQGTFGNLILYVTESHPGRPNPFQQVLTAPLAPFRAMEGMDNTGYAIHRFTDTANRFNEILSDTPESMRWQMLLFLYELQNSELSTSVLKHMEDFAEQSRRFVEQVETLPGDVRKELTLLLEQMEDKQEAALETLKALEAASDSLRATGAALDLTAQSWGSAAGATTQTIEAWRDYADSRPADDVPIRPEEVQAAALEVQNAAREIRQAMADLDNLTQSEAVARVQKNFEEAIEASRTAAQAVVDRLAWKLAQVLGGAIVLSGVVAAVMKRKRN
ncbi:MAG: hypothetical protein IH624_16045 [Phycisphaerae bacterium]|nr:hypothetical protein [Phycisphaerae bacterium]